MDEPAVLRAVRAAYDTVATEYARLLPDLRAEAPLDLAMLAAFAELTRSAGLGPVADLGCGTGRIATYLHALDVDVMGIDLSPGMLQVARCTSPHLRFAVGSISALPLPDACMGGVLAWYSTIHTPLRELPGVFAELSRVLAPGGYLLSGFHVGDGARRIAQAYGTAVSVDAYDVTPEQVAKLAYRAGLTLHAQMVRAPQGREKRPQASLLAAKPAISVS